MWEIQFHPLVTHTPFGPIILKNFVVGVCGTKQDWVMTDYANEFIEVVRAGVGQTDHVIGAVSGGFDSTVAAVLMTRVIGDRFHAILVDNGCLRKDEATHVLPRMRDDCGVNLRCVPASDRFPGLLSGVTDPENKRKDSGTSVYIFQEEVTKMEAEISPRTSSRALVTRDRARPILCRCRRGLFLELTDFRRRKKSYVVPRFCSDSY